MTENNTEFEFLANKYQQSDRAFKRSWIVDDRSDKIKEGLQGDSDLKVSLSFDEVAQNQSYQINQKIQIENTILENLEKSKINQVNSSCNKQKNCSQFCTNKQGNQQSENKFVNQRQISSAFQNTPLKQLKQDEFIQKNNTDLDIHENQKIFLSKNTQKPLIKHLEKDQRCSAFVKKKSLLQEQQNIMQFNQLSRIVHVKVKEFIKKVKLISKNRKPENLSKFQIEKIADSCYYYFEDNQYYQNSAVLKLQQSFKQLIKSIPIFIPTNKIVILYDIFSITYCYFFLFLLSILAFFNQNEQNQTYFANCCVIAISIMILDILQAINLAFFRGDEIIKNRCIIIKSYLISFHFLADFISLAILLEKITSNPKQITFNSENSIFSYLLISIIFTKFYSVKKKINRLENIITLKQDYKRLYELFRHIFGVFIIAHISCIGWYLLAVFQSQEKNWLQHINIENSAYYIKYLKRKNVNVQLKTRAIQYLFFKEEEINSKLLKEEEQVLSVLSPKLREEIIQEFSK
ncbi:hypothetical protein ABPG72_021813 [Tetrahymena utriculariae]